MKYLILEWKKAKWQLVQICLPMMLFLCLYCLYGYQDLSAHDLSQGYYRAIMQFYLMNAILTPITIATMASRLWDMENKGSAYKLLYTMEPRLSLFYSKLALGSFYLFWMGLLQIGYLLAVGKVMGFTQPVPWADLCLLAGSLFLISESLLLLQLLLSFLFPNQLYALFLGILGSFIGLFSFFLPSTLLRLTLPWGYYSAVCFINNSYEEATRTADFYRVPFFWPAMLCLLIFSALMYAAARYVILKKEV